MKKSIFASTKTNFLTKMRHPETYALWRNFVLGDNDALSALYNFYVHKLFSYGLKIHGDEQLVKDCIQEVFIQLIDKRKKLTLSDTTPVYLFKSLRNKLLEELRTKSRRINIVNSIPLDDAGQEISAEQTKIKSEEEHYHARILAQALDLLSDYQKEAVYLKYSQGFDYEKIAEVLEIDIASARTLIYRSLKKVRESLVDKIPIFFFLFRRL